VQETTGCTENEICQDDGVTKAFARRKGIAQLRIVLPRTFEGKKMIKETIAANKNLALTGAELNGMIALCAQFRDPKTVMIAKGVSLDKIKAKLERLKRKKPIAASSRKAKGRILQKWAVAKIAELLEYRMPAEKDLQEIRSREMGQSGADVVIKSEKLRMRFPFAVECKNQEQISLFQWIEQAQANVTETLPRWMLIVKNKKLKKPVVIIDWEGVEALYVHRTGSGDAELS